jgi:multiple sugar transport system substrate-binding protein
MHDLLWLFSKKHLGGRTVKPVNLKMMVIMLLAAMTFGLFAQTGVTTQTTYAQDGRVDLRFTMWSGNAEHLALFNGMAEEYKVDHPNVNIEFVTIPFGDYVSTLTLQLAGSDPPDGGWVVDNVAPTFIEAGVLTDLRPTLEAYPEYNLADIPEAAFQLWARGDKIYGVPFSTSPFVIFYNKTLFEESGLQTPTELYSNGEWTWEALATAAQTIAEATDAYGLESYDGLGYAERVWNTLIPFIRAFGGDAWDREGNCLLNSPESIAGVQFYHDMIFEAKSAVPPGEIGDFFSGQSAMTITQLSRTAKLTDAAFEWDVVPLPTGPAGNAQIIGQAAFVVFNASPNRDVAQDFVAFMTLEKNVAKMAPYFPPAREAVLNSEAFLSSNALVSPESMKAAVVDSVRVGSALPDHPEFPRIDLAARAEFDRLWNPDADVAAVMNDVCEAISPFLSH